MGNHYNSVRLITDPCDSIPLALPHHNELKLKVVPMEEKKWNFKGKPTRLDIVNYALEQTGFTS